MKKILSVLLLAAMLVACFTCFTACGAAGKTLADVKSAGKLVAATSPDFPPFESLEEGTGNVIGIEPELLQMIADQMGVELVFEQMDFDSVLAGVPAGKFDVGMSGISVDDERKESALFTDPYCLAAQAIVVTESSSIASKADLDGKKVSVQTATTAEKFCMNSGYSVLAFAANNDAEAALVNGNVDAWVIDDLTAAEMVAAYNETAADGEKLVILGEAMTTEPYAFMFAFGSEDLVEEINGILNSLVDDGTVAALFEKYNAPYTSPKN